jgi:hypothetical protein
MEQSYCTSAGRLIINGARVWNCSIDPGLIRSNNPLRRHQSVSLPARWAETYEALRVMQHLPAVCNSHVDYRGRAINLVAETSRMPGVLVARG